jgi:hypothetical protein
MLKNIQIDGIWYPVDEAVEKRMSEYHDTMSKAIKAYDLIKNAALNLRDIQKEYFKSRDTRVLAKSKEAEHLFDELLKDKPKNKVEQKQLF